GVPVRVRGRHRCGVPGRGHPGSVHPGRVTALRPAGEHRAGTDYRITRSVLNAPVREIEMSVTYYSGLDLGRTQDHSALVVIERSEEGVLAVRHIHRWPLGTSYPQIADDLKSLFAAPPLQGSTLVIDHTGVGVAGGGPRPGVGPGGVGGAVHDHRRAQPR